MKLCECGCGEPLPPNKHGNTPKFRLECWMKVRTVYLSRKAKEPKRIAASIERITKVNTDVKNGLRKSGRWIDGKLRAREDGYIMVKMHGHPRANNLGYVFEHILIMEKRIGRFLTKEEVVHHINRVRSDNQDENLLLLPDGAAHQRLHAAEDNRRDNFGRFTSYPNAGECHEVHTD